MININLQTDFISTFSDLLYFSFSHFKIVLLLWAPERVTNENANTDIR